MRIREFSFMSITSSFIRKVAAEYSATRIMSPMYTGDSTARRLHKRRSEKRRWTLLYLTVTVPIGFLLREAID
ncbi:hypothetical protein R84B8_01510 [Treponema sp. R8-4-B8]